MTNCPIRDRVIRFGFLLNLGTQVELLEIRIGFISLIVLLLVWIIGRKESKLNFIFLSVGLIIKIIVGVIFIELYTNHYGNGTLSADANKFLDESRVLNKVYSQSKTDYFTLLFGIPSKEDLGKKYLEETHHWDTNSQLIFNDNRNLMRVHSVVYFVSNGSIYVHLILFAFISLLAFYILAKSIARYLKTNERWTFAGLLLIPSVLFWSSSILKEPLLFLGIAILVSGSLNMQNKTRSSIQILFGSLLILAFKPYVLICLVPAYLFAYLYARLSRFKFFIFSSLVLILTVCITLFTATGEKITHKLSRKQFDFLNISQGGMHLLGDESFYYVSPDEMAYIDKVADTAFILKSFTAKKFDYQYQMGPEPIELYVGDRFEIFFSNEQSQSYIQVTPIRDDPFQLIKNIPQALINVLFRPFVTDSGSWLIFPAIIETLLIWILLIIGLKNNKKLDQKEQSLVVGLLVFIISLSLLIGWTTPVLGAINRYRIPIFLAMGILGILLWSKNKRRIV